MLIYRSIVTRLFTDSFFKYGVTVDCFSLLYQEYTSQPGKRYLKKVKSLSKNAQQRATGPILSREKMS